MRKLPAGRTSGRAARESAACLLSKGSVRESDLQTRRASALAQHLHAHAPKLSWVSEAGCARRSSSRVGSVRQPASRTVAVQAGRAGSIRLLKPPASVAAAAAAAAVAVAATTQSPPPPPPPPPPPSQHRRKYQAQVMSQTAAIGKGNENPSAMASKSLAAQALLSQESQSRPGPLAPLQPRSTNLSVPAQVCIARHHLAPTHSAAFADLAALRSLSKRSSSQSRERCNRSQGI
jgi:hypothetical protein